MKSKQKTEFRRSKEWKNLRQLKLAETNHCCEMCGVRRKIGLNVHHRDPDNYTDLEPDKFIVLCKYHHELLEHLLRRKVFNVDLFAENLVRIYKQSKRGK